MALIGQPSEHSAWEAALIEKLRLSPNVLVGFGALWHVDHLMQLGFPKRMILYDPEWARMTPAEFQEEVALLREAGATDVRMVKDRKHRKQFSFLFNGMPHEVIFHFTAFDPKVVAKEKPEIIHGPHFFSAAHDIRPEQEWNDDKLAETVALAQPGTLFLNCLDPEKHYPFSGTVHTHDERTGFVKK